MSVQVPSSRRLVNGWVAPGVSTGVRNLEAGLHGSSADSVRVRKILIALAALAGTVVIALVDFQTGVEYRVFPLYFLPISLAAWNLGHAGAIGAATLAAFSWLISNYFGGLHFSHPAIWVFNFVMQGTSFVLMGSLIATLRNALDRAHGLSRIDPLTSLLNGRAFFEDTERILTTARRYGHAVTLAYVDLDNFKALNDRFGHVEGDNVLRRMATLLGHGMRESDLCARIGGDEFVALLFQTDQDGAFATLI